jgi:hypothetical protein
MMSFRGRDVSLLSSVNWIGSGGSGNQVAPAVILHPNGACCAVESQLEQRARTVTRLALLLHLENTCCGTWPAAASCWS